jgi:hypothetical protein
MKIFIRVAAVVLVIVLGVYLFQKAGRTGATDAGPTNAVAAGNNPGSAAVESNPGNAQVVPIGPSPASGGNVNAANDLAARAGSPQPITVDTNAAPLAPSAILENMRLTIRSYNTQFGENPVGNNAEITAALMGKNPRHLNFIQPDSSLQVNENGELVDAWGTPFFFHQLSGQVMEIHSAGPDKKMWTSDDSVAR